MTYLDLNSLDVTTDVPDYLRRAVRVRSMVVLIVSTHGNVATLLSRGRLVSRPRLESALEILAITKSWTMHVLWQCCQGTVSSHLENLEYLATVAQQQSAAPEALTPLSPELCEREPHGDWICKELNELRTYFHQQGALWSDFHTKARVYHWYFAPMGYLLRRHKTKVELELDAANFLYLFIGLGGPSRLKTWAVQEIFRKVQSRWNHSRGSLKISF